MYKTKRNNNGGIIALSWTKKRNDCEKKKYEMCCRCKKTTEE